jgi:predicted TIM-barrel fold metal-dependent hydrolase
VVVVSADTHIGPRLVEDLRPYCPKKHLEAFDDYVSQDVVYRQALAENSPENYRRRESDGRYVRAFHNMVSTGHFDMKQRIKDMNYDGVAAEVLFHNTLNDEPIPFANMGDPGIVMTFKANKPTDPEMTALGRHIFNAWLADACNEDPGRHVGLAQIPVWDVDETIREMRWAAEQGLRGINFPAPQAWLPEYNKPHWEPVWSAAEELGVSLVTHLGAGSDADYSGPDGRAILLYEIAAVYGKRIMPWLIFGGVFERHPGLKLTITEIPGSWWTTMLDEMDSVWRRWASKMPQQVAASVDEKLTDLCPRQPSDYCREQVFIGSSFMSKMEAEQACLDGSWQNLMWGSDYPHPEGTFRAPESPDELSLTRSSLQYAYQGLQPDYVRAMVGSTAAQVYGLDYEMLKGVAAEIEAPTMDEMTRELELASFDQGTSLAFRQRGIFD